MSNDTGRPKLNEFIARGLLELARRGEPPKLVKNRYSRFGKLHKLGLTGAELREWERAHRYVTQLAAWYMQKRQLPHVAIVEKAIRDADKKRRAELDDD